MIAFFIEFKHKIYKVIYSSKLLQTFIIYNMKKYKIITSYPCLIKAGDESIELDQNNYAEFTSQTKLSVYPVGKTNLFAFNIQLGKLTDSPYYKFEKNGDEIVIFLPDGMKCTNYDLFSFSSSSISPSVEIGKNQITFLTQNCKKVVDISPDYNQYKCYKKDNILFAHISATDKEMIVAMNTKNGKIKSFKGQKIEVEKDKFIVYQDCKDIAGHKLTTTYKIDKEGLKRVGYDINYSFPSPRMATIDETIPFAFLEAVKLEDFSLAYNYLSDKIKNKIGLDDLSVFLPKIEYYFKVTPFKFYLKTIEGEKTISFEIEHGKIVDIDINDKN